jgi:hypothetical protein
MGSAEATGLYGILIVRLEAARFHGAAGAPSRIEQQERVHS